MIQFLSQIIFYLPYFGTSVILLALVLIFFLWNKKFHRFLNIAVLLVIAFFLLAWISQLISLYLSIKDLPANASLLRGLNSFFFEKALAVSRSYLITATVTGLLYGATLLLKKWQKKPYFNNFAAKVVLITTLSLGFSNVLPLIILALILAILFSLFHLLSRDHSDRSDMVPFLLLSALILRLLSIFPLYSQILGFLHLI